MTCDFPERFGSLISLLSSETPRLLWVALKPTPLFLMHLVASIAEFSPFNNAEVEDDEDDPASLAADMWFGAQEIESGVAEADDECEGVDPASLTAELWFSAPPAISRAEDEDDDDDDSASVAADMWFQDEQQTMSANTSGSTERLRISLLKVGRRHTNPTSR